MDKIFKLIELILKKDVSLYQIIMLLISISPSFLIFTIPIAFLCGVLLTFGRLSTDCEIIAFKASGISLYQLFYPIFIISIFIYLITSSLVFYGLPWGNRGFQAMLYMIAHSKSEIELKERVFNDNFEGLVIYVDKIPLEDKKLEGILIYDEREKNRTTTVFAQKGFLIPDPQTREIVLRLIDGDIHRYESKSNVYQKIKFNSYDIKLELTKAISSINKKLKKRELSIKEIKTKIVELKKFGENTIELEIELHKRYAFPFASIIFALIGVPLGIKPRRSGRSYGFILTILIILSYYFLISIFEIIGLKVKFPLPVIAWGPNIIIGGFGLYLLIRSANERSFKSLKILVGIIENLQYKWKRFF